MFVRLASVLLLCWGLQNAATVKKAGDSCKTPKGIAGECKIIVKCAPAIDNIKRGIIPTICGFNLAQLIVCCTDSAHLTTKRITSTTKKTATSSSTVRTTTAFEGTSGLRKPGEVSKKKCKEFAKYAIAREGSPVLSLFPTTTNILECAFEKEKLIKGGTLASRQEFPHMAQLGYGTADQITWACGGAVISEYYVLTAGHCLKSRDLGEVTTVRAGITNLTDSTHQQQRTVAEIIPHPLYKNKKYHDIGLLRMTEKFDLNTWVRPACLHTEKDLPYENAIAAGWGKIDFAGDDSKELFKVKLEIFSVEKCNKTYRRDINQVNSPLKDGILDDLMICAGSSTEYKDTCQGDSGGPLQYYLEDNDDIKCMYDLIGVTSFGKSCGIALNAPGVYTRVSKYLKWIEDTVWT